jgi:hypothetical protein
MEGRKALRRLGQRRRYWFKKWKAEFGAGGPSLSEYSRRVSDIDRQMQAIQAERCYKSN